MSKAVKGKKGFQAKNPNDKRVKRAVFYLTEAEDKRLKEYCTKLGVTPSLIIRELIHDIIKD